MKKHLLTTLFLLGIFTPPYLAAAEVVTLEFNKTEFSDKVQNYTSTWTTTHSNRTWELVNFNNNQSGWNYVKCGSKNSASVATITNKAAFTEKISKITVTLGAVTASAVNSISLKTSSSKDFSNASSIKYNEKTLAKGDLSFDIPSPESDLFYQLVFDCKKSSSNGSVQVDKIVYTIATDGGETPVDPTDPKELGAITITANGTALTDAEMQDIVEVEKGTEIAFACATEGATITITDGFGNDGYNVADQPLPYSFTANDEVWLTYLIQKDGYTSVEGLLALNIKENTPVGPTKPNATLVHGNWQLVTTATELEAGMKFIIANKAAAKAISTEDNQNNRRSTDITLSEDKLNATIGIDAMIFQLGGENDKWSIKTTNYLGTNGFIGNTNNGKNYCTVTRTEHTATITISETGSATITFSNISSRNIVRYNPNNGNPLFSCYSSGQEDVFIYKFVDVEPATPVISGTEIDSEHLFITGAIGTTIYYKTLDWEAATQQRAFGRNATDLEAEGFIKNEDAETPHILHLAKNDHLNKIVHFLAVSPTGLQSPVSLHGIKADGSTTGIEGIGADNANAPVEWFNLQGVRVANPQGGLYIRRQSTMVEKVLVK